MRIASGAMKIYMLFKEKPMHSQKIQLGVHYQLDQSFFDDKAGSAVTINGVCYRKILTGCNRMEPHITQCHLSEW